jgi:hypothetical protein
VTHLLAEPKIRDADWLRQTLPKMMQTLADHAAKHGLAGLERRAPYAKLTKEIAKDPLAVLDKIAVHANRIIGRVRRAMGPNLSVYKGFFFRAGSEHVFDAAPISHEAWLRHKLQIDAEPRLRPMYAEDAVSGVPVKVINGGQRMVVDKSADEASGLRAFKAYMDMNKSKTSITIGPNVPPEIYAKMETMAAARGVKLQRREA